MSSPAVSQFSSDEVLDKLLLDIAVKAKSLQVHDEDVVPLIGSNEWNDLQPVLREWERSTHLRYVRQTLEEKIRNKVIFEWVEKYVAGSDYEKRTLVNEIEAYIKEDREEGLREYLSNVLDLGLKKARKTRNRKKWGDGGYLGHAWEAIVGIVRLVVVVGIFSVAQSKFETVVFAMLVMTYYAVYRTSLGQFQGRTAMAIGIDNQFRRVRRLSKEELSKEDRETEYENEQEVIKVVGRQTVNFWIQMAFFSLIWLVTMWKLITAVFL